MADERIVRGLIRLHTRAEILVIYGKAMAAYAAASGGAVIGQSMEGLSTTMALPADPAALVDACEAALARIDGELDGPRSAVWDFRNRRIGT